MSTKDLTVLLKTITKAIELNPNYAQESCYSYDLNNRQL